MYDGVGLVFVDELELHELNTIEESNMRITNLLISSNMKDTNDGFTINVV
ncbi:hypothetical protein J2T15_001395 [Paenibacillus harenae]|uniref:Uncharacterized protein n=1 Tax=Paenibacillus harenae TaxID=306543 RepID=A0ABT9TX60_PAEHA|nr:hypothetical protein [Paenibacillus harenae]MDQ0111960.1 hypothetical protein [Paenibacillus harenae]